MNTFIPLLVLGLIGMATAAAVGSAQINCAKPPVTDPDSCCKAPMFFADDLVLSCETKLRNNKPETAAECIATCMLNGTNNLNPNGSVKKDALAAFFIKATNDASFNPVLTKAVNLCASEAEKKSSDFAKMMNASPGACNAQGLFLLDCTYMQIFKSCPASRWTSNADCATLKQYVNKCSVA